MNDDKLEQAVFQIFQMTHMGNLAWSRRDAPRSIWGGTDLVISAYFETELKGQRLALFQERYRQYHGELDSERWTERTVLAMLDRYDQVQFEFPQSSQVWDLLETVKYKTSNVDGFLQSLLKPQGF
ncbi:hypothetical protein ACFOY5_16885 [Massilia aurea]|uniref:hypothetical protein n=1 Tax=Massilia aurea TaxID=373040 RepID=UPI0021629DC7|nr:hypothetical protein [Massilia aurea]MCS0706434.1 hypothetical protein [Massilia aurea]